MLVGLLAIAGPAWAAWMVPPSPFRAKDFTLVKRDGWFHCFYIRRDMSVPYDSTERDLGHAVSRDLYIWTQLPPVLPVRPSHWDQAKVWAPDIREIDGVYYMFYTGVTNVPGEYAFHQQIGLATSTDLMTWNRLDEPVFTCSQVRWSYCDRYQYTGGEFRDAFVMPDPSGTGWLMYYTARPASVPETYICGVASSSGDLTEWVNRDPLWISHDSWSGSSVVESPHVFKHGSLYYLVFTGNGNQPLRLATGPDPTGEASTWTYRGSLGPILGLNASEWYASEYFVDGIHEYFCFINFDRVDFRKIVWGSDWRFTLVGPPLFHVQSMTWDRSGVAEGETARLRIEAVNTLGRQAYIEAIEVDADGSEQPIPLHEIGLPDSIAIAGPTTDFFWTARSWQDPEEPGDEAEIVVRLTDGTAAAKPSGAPECAARLTKRRGLVRSTSSSPPGTKVPARKLVLGSPAKAVRDLKPEELEHLHQSAANYVAAFDRIYLELLWKSFWIAALASGRLGTGERDAIERHHAGKTERRVGKSDDRRRHGVRVSVGPAPIAPHYPEACRDRCRFPARRPARR